MFFSSPAGHKFTVKADQQSYDFTIGDFTINYQFHDLDLSSIIPVGTVAVLLWGEYKSDSTYVEFTFTKAGYTGAYVKDRRFLPVANIARGITCVIPVSADRKIQYRISSATFAYVNLNVVAWWV